MLDHALKISVAAGQLGTAQQLLEKGADPNFEPQHTSLLFDSIGDNDRPMSELLIRHGADLEFKDKQWNSGPLGWQVFFGKPGPTRLAVGLGAQIPPNLLELAEAGMRGELRRWSAGTAEGYREVLQFLQTPPLPLRTQRARGLLPFVWVVTTNP